MNGNQVVEINLDDILPNRFQPRIKFHEKNINELAESIREHGVIQPIVVRKISDKYEIIAGERRYKASVIAGKTTIPALIVHLNDQDAAEVALIENVQRQDLTPIEEAVSYKKILDMGMTQEQLATKLGKTQSTVANKLRLLNLDEDVQEALLDQKISERHARSLLKLSGNNAQRDILKRIIEERLTVRKTDQVIKEYIEKEQNEQLDEIEVLDFSSESNEKEEKNNNMNENMNYNIPFTPIENDNNNVVPNQTIPEVEPISAIPTQNPGFVDVNRIENQAQDIFTPTPLADMDNLLHQDASMVTETVEPEENVGKFFTMGMPTEPTPSSSNFVADIEKAETNMDFMPQEETPAPKYNFDAFFNNNFVETPQPIAEVEEKPVVETPVENPTQQPIFNNVNPMGEITGVHMEAPVEPTIPTFNPTPQVEPIESQPVQFMPEASNSVNSTQTLETPVFSMENSFPFFEEPVIEPIEPQVSTPVEPQVEPTPQDLGFNMDFRNLTPDGLQSTPTVEPVMPTPNVEQSAPVEPIMPEVPAFNFNFDAPVTPVQESVEVAPAVESVPNTQNIVLDQPVATSTSNVRMAIDLVRNCASQLEALGYKIDLEEFDLENTYQVIFKIEK